MRRTNSGSGRRRLAHFVFEHLLATDECTYSLEVVEVKVFGKPIVALPA
jgi:hypothetical protein